MELKETIGITGGIGSGKSVVCRVLRCNGKYVYDCDSQARNLMENNAEVKAELVEKFGNEIYTATGSINKPLMSKIVFGDNNLRCIVNKVVHDAVRKDIQKKRECIEGFFFIESAILASSGIASLCNSVWLVNAPLKTRISRIMKRDHLDEKVVKARITSQEKEMELLSSFDPVILENDDESPLLDIIFSLIHKDNKLTYTQLC